MNLLALCLLVLASALGAQTPAPRPIQREVLQVPTRKGVTQPCLLLTEAPSPRAVALLFPGGDGVLGLGRRSLAEGFGPSGNFLVRSAELLLSPELALALVDVPSDAASGMDDAFRMGDDHLADVRALVQALRLRFPGARVFLVGTSRGTVSAAYGAEALGADLDGVVLTSSVLVASRRNPGLSGFRFARVKAPILFVHHGEDGCPACPYGAAVRAAAKATLITVHGGLDPRSGPCDPLSAHGFFGRETEVTQAIRAWILGRPLPKDL